MREDIFVGTMFWGTFYVVGVWVLFHWCYRDYRVDVFRQKLFNLRGELFSLAASGKVDFDSPAYGMTRMTLNGFVRFAHRFSVTPALMMSWRMRRAPKEWSQFEVKWDQAVAECSAEAQEEIRSIRRRMHEVVVEQLIVTSFVLWVLIVPVFAVTVAAWCFRRLAASVEESAIWRFWVYPLDDAALNVGELNAFRGARVTGSHAIVG